MEEKLLAGIIGAIFSGIIVGALVECKVTNSIEQEAIAHNCAHYIPTDIGVKFEWNK